MEYNRKINIHTKMNKYTVLEMNRMTNYKIKRKKTLFRQRLLGLLILVLCLVFLIIAYNGKYPDEQDITVILLLFPMGICTLLTRG